MRARSDRDLSVPSSALGRVGVACALLAGAVACVLGCLRDQDLGAPSVDDHAGNAATASSATSDPGAGFAALPVDDNACPPANKMPKQGDDCSAETTARECTYAYAPLDLPTDTTCGQSCVCAIDHQWRCAWAPCVTLGPSACAEGVACAGDLRCWAQCDEAETSCLSCACRDGRLVCQDKGGRPPR